MGVILLVGAEGQLGRALVAAASGSRLVALPRQALDVTDGAAVEDVIRRTGPAVVVNATAYNRVDDAERDPAAAFQVNAVAVHHLARSAARHGARLVHFSTDYVFGAVGTGPFTEEAGPAPLNAYGASKLAGEQLLRLADARHVVVRTAALYGTPGTGGKGGNFVDAVLAQARAGRPLRVVTDQVTSPTYAADLADGALRLVEVQPPGGVYHLVNEGACSWFEFAREILSLCGLEPDLAPTTSAAYGAPARRPANSALASCRLGVLGLPPLRPWREALRAYLGARGLLAR
jgi:dTDP-4-dehydrorhamnose reductase